jgi:hypothetical protein
MGTQSQSPGSQPKPTAPGKPASRQPPDSNTGKEGPRGNKDEDRNEGQEIPKTALSP